MAGTFYLEIISPDRQFFAGDVEMVILKTPEGEIGILNDHIPLVSAIDIGPVKIQQDGKWLTAVASEGFVEIGRDKVTVLVDTIEWPEEIDVKRAQAALERAEKKLKDEKLSKEREARTRASMSRALERLRIAKHH